jgi:uncharacterized phage protein (TIGR02220 family)
MKPLIVIKFLFKKDTVHSPHYRRVDSPEGGFQEANALSNLNINALSNLKENTYREFISLINKLANRNFRGDDKSKRQFQARLKNGYTLEDFKKAIEAVLADPWHKESNFKHLDPEFITRPDKLEKYLNRQVKVKNTIYNATPVVEVLSTEELVDRRLSIVENNKVLREILEKKRI